jgi:transposase-like protein/IS1 family transposase
MLCPICQTESRKFGKDRYGNQRFQCIPCGKTFAEREARPLGTMRIGVDKALHVLQLLLEGMSIRATMCVTGTNRNTILDLLALMGDRCEKLLATRIKGLPVEEVQVDEVWGYVFCKEKTRTRAYPDQAEVGDAYCFVGIERSTKLIRAWHLGRRSTEDTHAFARKLAAATTGRFQVTTDGFRPYQSVIPAELKGVDFATLAKLYATKDDDYRYSPGEVTGTVKNVCCGSPDPQKICTSHVERGNLTVRTQDRRMTRLTNAFSKKWANHHHSMALHFAWFNFGRVHRTLKTTPAVAAKLEERPWTLRELVERSTQS